MWPWRQQPPIRHRATPSPCRWPRRFSSHAGRGTPEDPERRPVDPPCHGLRATFTTCRCAPVRATSPWRRSASTTQFSRNTSSPRSRVAWCPVGSRCWSPSPPTVTWQMRAGKVTSGVLMINCPGPPCVARRQQEPSPCRARQSCRGCSHQEQRWSYGGRAPVANRRSQRRSPEEGPDTAGPSPSAPVRPDLRV